MDSVVKTPYGDLVDFGGVMVNHQTLEGDSGGAERGELGRERTAEKMAEGEQERRR